MSQDVSELICLQEELERCKADKDFVWSLWKQLQQDSPNITEAISLVVTREKAKRDQEFELLLNDKEEKISLLHKEVESHLVKMSSLEDQVTSQRLQGEAIESQMLTEQSEQLRQAAEENSQLISKLANNEKKATELAEKLLQQSNCDNDNIKRLIASNDCIVTEKQRLTQTIECLENQVLELQGQLKDFTEQQAERELSEKKLSSLESEHKKEIKCLQQKMESIETEKSSYQNNVSKLTEQLEANQNELEDTKRMLTLAESRLQEDKLLSAAPNMVEQLEDVKEFLEKTEKELFEVKSELSSKNKELECMREKHERRLNRMRSLNESHNLVLKQLKTYETSSADKKSHAAATLNRGRSPVRDKRHENNDQIRNELTHYKAKCQELEKDKMVIEEEMDSLSVVCAGYKSTISELRSSLEQNHHSLEDKETVLKEMTKAMSSTSLEQERRQNERESERAHLREQNEQLLNTNRSLDAQCGKLKRERLRLKETVHSQRQAIDQLQNDVVISPQMINQSTMTNHLRMTSDSCIQVESLPVRVSMETEPFRFSSSSAHSLVEEPVRTQPRDTKTQTGSRKRHKRSHSDGDLLVSYCLLSQALDKLSQTLHSPPDSNRSNQPDQKNKLNDPPHRGCKHDHRDSSHKCKWYVQFKNTQHRMKSLMQQVDVLTQAKVSAIKSLEHCQTEKLKLEREVKPLQDKVASQRGIIQELKEDLKIVEASHIELQGRCNGYKSIGLNMLVEEERRIKLEEGMKQFKEEKKILSEKCSSLTEQLKVLHTELVLREKEKETFEERCQHMERDLKHKRQYLTELKKKVTSLESKASTDEEKLNHYSDHVTMLQDSLEQYKHRISAVKTQSEYHSKEKDRLTASLAETKDDLKSTKLQMKAVQDEHRRKLSLLKESGEKKEQVLKGDYHRLIIELEKRAGEAETCILHYQGFIKDLAQEVSGLQKKSKHQPKEKDKVTERARKIAQDTFDLSDLELDKLMSSQEEEGSGSSLLKSTHHFIHHDNGGIVKSRQKLLTEFLNNISSLLSQ